MIGWIYTATLFGVIAYIFTYGERDERIVAATLLAGSFSTFMIYARLGTDFTAVALPMLFNEILVTTVLLAVAFWSKRFWPLPVAAFQLAALLSLMTPYFGKNIVSNGLGVAQGIWAYPQIAILILATIRGRNREKRRFSPS